MEEEEAEDCRDETSRSQEPCIRTFFQRTYEAMTHEKWELRSGSCVEDIIYRQATKMDSDAFTQSLAQFFVLDISSPVVQGWFTESEWAEIMASIVPLPKADTMLAKWLTGLTSVRTTTQLRQFLWEEGVPPNGVHYDRSIHYNLDWAATVLHKLYIFPPFLIPPQKQ